MINAAMTMMAAPAMSWNQNQSMVKKSGIVPSVNGYCHYFIRKKTHVKPHTSYRESGYEGVEAFHDSAQPSYLVALGHISSVCLSPF